MNDIEHDLRNALRRQEPPPGFSGRVLSRIQPAEASRRKFLASLGRGPSVRWVAVAALIVLCATAGIMEHRREQRLRAQGEMAKAQVMQALRITSFKLNAARRKVHEIGRRSEDPRPQAIQDSSQIKG